MSPSSSRRLRLRQLGSKSGELRRNFGAMQEQIYHVGKFALRARNRAYCPYCTIIFVTKPVGIFSVVHRDFRCKLSTRIGCVDADGDICVSRVQLT